jgi:hypothetical protein
MMMNVKKAVATGLQDGLDTTWKLAKLIIPIYFFITILKSTPFLPMIASFFQPALGLAGVPGEAAVALIMGAFVNVYAAIAALLPLVGSLPLSPKQITIIATMVLICHSIPMESAVSHKTGVPFWLVTVLRPAVAFIMGILLNVVM